MRTAGPLEGLRVLDCSLGGAGPRATALLADYGAEVTWIEPPGGDPARRSDPAGAAVFNRGKRSVVFDLEKPEDRERVLDLAARADVFVESWQPGVADTMGFGFQDLRTRNPQLIYCSISGFGAADPHVELPPYEPLVQALMGTMAQQAGHREGPIFQALPFACAGAAQLAVIGVLAALYRRLEDGVGRHVETSLVDGVLAFHSMQWGESDAALAAAGGPSRPSTNVMLRPSATRMVTRSFVCGDDKYLGVHTLAVGGFGRLMDVLGLSDRIPPTNSGLDLATPLTPDQAEYLEDNIHRIFAEHPRDYWVKRLVEADVCAIEHLPPTEVFDEAQTRHNEMVIALDDPVLGRTEQVAPCLRFDGVAPPVERPAPRVGQDTAEVVRSLAGAPPSSRWRTMSPAPGGPDRRPLLDGVRIVDLGAFYAGPYASRLLADLGADVVKVEPTIGDQMRGLERGFFSAQAGKRSLAANLKDPALAPAVKKLIDWADVVHHNMRPGAAERLGLGKDQVRAVKSSVIYLYSPGWGSSGPHMLRQSFAPMLFNLAGASYEVAGEYNEPMPPTANEDVGNGLSGAIALLMALLVRRMTGEALSCESPQLNAAMGLMAHVVRKIDGEVVGAGLLDVTQSGTSALESLYQTADGWLCLAVRNDQEIAALQALLDIDILGDRRFADLEARQVHRESLTDILRGVFERRATADWLEAFRGSGLGLIEPADVDCSHRFLNDPDQRRAGRIAEVSHPEKGNVREIDQLVRIGDADIVPHRLAPDLGAHTAELLAAFGYTAGEIDALRAKGSIR
jgi:crotonobetainyl-CoA:carnitine CoA-transferase CaiB-like acyl-CoA transferase